MTMKIWEMTAVSIGERIRQGEFTSEEAVRSFLDRAEGEEERIHAFVHLDGEGDRSFSFYLSPRAYIRRKPLAFFTP